MRRRCLTVLSMSPLLTSPSAVTSEERARRTKASDLGLSMLEDSATSDGHWELPVRLSARWSSADASREPPSVGARYAMRCRWRVCRPAGRSLSVAAGALPARGGGGSATACSVCAPPPTEAACDDGREPAADDAALPIGNAGMGSVYR